MKRPASSGKLGISLFPFLDALICMMGGLIVILAAVNHSAAQQAVLKQREKTAQVAAAPTLPTPAPEPVVDDTAAKALETLSETRDELAWRIEHLRSSREKTAHDLQYERLRLSSAENQVTQLKQQLAELSGALQQIQGTSAQQNQSRAQLAQTLEATRQQLDAAKQRVARAQQEAANKKPSYAVVPYEGPNRTKRRPIYIECTAEKIIIQPEGIIVLPSDLAGPPGPGNPLASTIRAIREGLLATSPDPSSPDAEPYPLFLVRPNGIVAYYEAREAMASWAHEIGYQVVEQDWPLTFPPADPNLALRGNQALADARQRFEWLAKQNPELAKRATSAPKTYRVSPTGGGLIAEGGPGGSASVPSWSESQGRGGAGGSGFDNSAQASNSGRYNDSTDVPNGGANSLAGLNPSTRIGSSYSGGGGMSSAAGTGQYQKAGLGNSQYAPGAAPTGVYGNLNPVMDASGLGGANGGGNGTGSSGGGMNGQGQYSAGGQGGSAMQNASMNGGPMSGNGTGSQSQGGAGQGAAGQASAGQASSYGMQGSAANGSGANSTASNGSASGAAGGSSAQGGGSQGGGSQGGGSPSGTSQQFGAASSGQKGSQNNKSSMDTSMANAAGPGAAPTTRQYGDLSQKQTMPSDGVPSNEISPINTPTPKRDTKSLASTKGKDWAVMRNGNGRSAVTRPVRLRVNGSQLVLLADATANEGEQIIPIYGDTGQAIPGLVQSVEKRIDKWGLAGKGLYWSPELVFEVTPDGEARYADLQTLLDNSGWIVRRKQ
jgi:hypothetical protein